MKIENITDLNRHYLSDESRMTGDANSIIFCSNIQDIQAAVFYAAENAFVVTVQGGRTGITGGAVPVKNKRLNKKQLPSLCLKDPVSRADVLVINLIKIKQVYSIRYDKEGFRIKAGAGFTLSEIESILKGEPFDISFLDKDSLENLEVLQKGSFFFPPDPTEKSASIGGVAANCASGSRTFHYGSARNFITAMDVVMADSSLISLKRDNPDNKTCGNSFSLTALNGNNIKGSLAEISNPACKNAAGIFTEENMDIIDLFIGSEGILGIISSVEFLVIPEPVFINGILIFPPDRETNFKLSEYFRDEGAFKYYNSDPDMADNCGRSCRDRCMRNSGKIRVEQKTVNSTENEFANKTADENINAGSESLIHDTGCRIAAVEYFDRNALSLVSSYVKEGLFKSLFPFSAENSGGALYVEIHSDNPDEGYKTMERIACLLDNYGVDEDSVFISDGEADLLRMKDFRHSVPESVNMTIDRIRKQGNDITKLGTDIAVPDSAFREFFDMYYSDLEIFSCGLAGSKNQVNESKSSAVEKQEHRFCIKNLSGPERAETDLPVRLCANSLKPNLPGLNYAVFGHIGDNHLHVNIIPQSPDEYNEGKKIIKKWAEKAVSLGGSVSAEHGTGRLKKEYLEIMYGGEGLEKIAHIKYLFDPGFVINRGVMI